MALHFVNGTEGGGSHAIGCVGRPESSRWFCKKLSGRDYDAGPCKHVCSGSEAATFNELQ